MATGLSQTLAHACLTNEIDTYTYVQLHTGSPGSDGTLLVATETDRVAATWGTPTAGVISNTNVLTWTGVAGSEDYTHFTVWSATSAGVFGFSGLITANPVVSGDTFTVAVGALSASLTLAS